MNILWLLSEIRTPFLDQFFQLVTYLGEELLVLVIICTLYWCVDKRFAYQLGFTYFTAGLFIQSLKITFRIPRPWVLDPNFKAVESAIPSATGYSFPSGHTQSATALYASFASIAKKNWQKIGFILCFLFVGFSRMYLGVHTPKDVLVSMCISLLFTWLVWRFQTFLLDKKQYTKMIAIILALISAAVIIYSLVLLNQGIIDLKYAADCCKASGAGLGFAVGFYVERCHMDFDTKTKTIWGQILKLVFGLGGALFIKLITPHLIGESIVAEMIEYFILVLWVLVIYPCVFSRFSLRASS